MVCELIKTIKITEELKLKLDKEKIHPRQSYDEIISQLIENAKTKSKK